MKSIHFLSLEKKKIYVVPNFWLVLSVCVCVCVCWDMDGDISQWLSSGRKVFAMVMDVFKTKLD